MFDFLGPSARAMAIVLAIGSAAYAQQPAPQPAPPEAPPTPEAPPPEAPPSDPQPAGVGSAAAPKPDPSEDTAQDQPNETSQHLQSRPFTGLFGGAAPVDPRRTFLNLNGSIYAVHLTDKSNGSITDPADPAAALVNATSNYGGVGGSMDFRHVWQSAGVGLNASDSVAYISSPPEEGGDQWINRWSTGGDASFNHDLSRRVKIHGAVAADYSPYYQQSLLTPGSLPSVGDLPVNAPGLDLITAKNPSVASTVDGGLDYLLSPKSMLEFTYTLRRVDFLEHGSDSNSDQLVKGLYRHQFNRVVGMHAGYGFRTARNASEPEPIHEHDLDVGADAGKGFELTRRTTFSFGTGSSVIVSQRISAPEDNPAQTGASTRLFATGNADLTHRWARSWSTSVGANQSLHYEPGFTQPLLSDSVYAALGGLLTRRLDVSVRADYTTGTVGFGTIENGFSTASSTGTVRYALTSQLATYAQGFYYHYSFDSGVALPSYLQQGLERYGVTVGLTTWIPLIGGQRH